MKIRSLIFATSLLVPVSAWAQSAPAWKSYQDTGNPADMVKSTQVSSWLAKKVDVASGTSTNQMLTTPTMTGASLSRGTTITGSGDLSFIPKGSPIAGSVGSVVITLGLGQAGVQNFGHNIECTSTAIAPANGGNVCQYTWTELTANSGGGWSQSLVTQLDSGFDTTKYSALVSEFDLNNLAGDYGEFSTANSIGTLYNGLGKMNTAAVSVQTGNSANGMTGTAGQLAIWYYGMHFGASAVEEADVDTQSSAVYGWRGRGSHVFGASYADDNTTSGAIQLGDLGAQQGIIGRNGSTNYAMMHMETDGSIHIGSLAQANWQSDGNPLPTTDNTYSLGSSTNRWSDVKTLHINGVPTLTEGTPTIGETCTKGTQYYDDTKLYMCMNDGLIHTLATVAN